MAHSSKVTIKGTRNPDTIFVDSDYLGFEGVTLNSVPTPYSADQIDSGFILQGGGGIDTITGGRGPDDLYGGAGNDSLTGGAGLDRLYGGDGNDTLMDAWDGAFFDGGRGIDLLNLSAETASIGVAMGNNIFLTVHGYDANGFPVVSTSVSGSSLSGRVTGIENLTTGSGDDLLLGTNGDNVLDGGGGNDLFNGFGGNDTILGRAGTDTIYGGAGTDSLWGGLGNDLFPFYALTDSSARDGIDTIMDFNPSTEGDRIDLTAIDSNPSLAGIQAWEFIGSNPPIAPSATGNGQATLTYNAVTGATVLNLYANDGDFKADFTLNILGVHQTPVNIDGFI